MEDDDEFGDLYTDVLRPFAASTPAPPPQNQTSPSPAQSLRRPIDLNNLQSEDEEPEGFGAPASSIPGLSTSGQTLAAENLDSASSAPKFLSAAPEIPRSTEDEVNFDIEEAEDDAIPGLQSNSEPAAGETRRNEEDWDSDESEDDLQIVLNGPTTMERGGGIGDGDDDEDEDDELVIVTGGEPNQPIEEQDWSEDAAGAVAVAGGEGKESGEAVKVGVAAVPKVGYGGHGYHPFHSQFKYVRPGATPIPGAPAAGPGGVPGQVRPLANMGLVAGRGRADWRPGFKNASQMQKFNPWGGNAAGRGFGGGLEFTLPSHKTIFDIDIDTFEEKPWKYPGADTSDFFNFGFSEDSWKDYCKQLEQHRIESTMQSKIRVYESGRTEQDYDPDLPPELAAATGAHEVLLENSNTAKSEVMQSDLPKGSARVRPPLPTGRAIQVENGCGERLPSIDTRPPRMRDSDAIIEIVLQDSLDDDVPAGDVSNEPDDDTPKSDVGGSATEADTSQVGSEYVDKYSQTGTESKRGQGGQRIQLQNSVRNDVLNNDGVLPFPPEPPARNGASSAYGSAYPGGGHSPGCEERQMHGRSHEKSPHLAPSRNRRDEKYLHDEPEDSVESMDSKHSPLSSPAILRDAHESSVEHRDDVDDQDDVILADGRSDMEKGESPSCRIAANDTFGDGTTKKQKLNPRSEDSFGQEPDDGEDSRAARSSDNSRARSGSSRDYVKRREGVEEEVIQRHSDRAGTVRRNFEDKEQGIHRRSRDGRQEPERNRMAVKGREDSYPYREFDPSSVHSHMRVDGFDRRKERENSDGQWQRRDDDPYSRRIRTEDTRKRERGEDTGSRHRSKVREGERIDKDEAILSRKQMDNGNRVYHDKDVGPRHRERDDNFKNRYELMDDYHGKKKKEDEHTRRDYADKEEMLHGHRETANRRKRERDDVLDQRKRDGQQRLRDNIDDHPSIRHKDESWLQRERGERGREKEDWQRVRQSHEENIPKRERDDGRGVARGGRSSEDRGWVSHPKAKDESKGSEKDYQSKETVRHSEASKRRDRIDDESLHHGSREDIYVRGNQISNGERRSRQERPRNDRSTFEDQKINDRKHKDTTRRNKEPEDGDNSALVTSKRNQDDNGGQSNETGVKETIQQGIGENNKQRLSLKRQKENASSEEDQQQDLRRGRSKLERWTSHKERDFSFKSKPSSALKLKESDKINNPGSLEGSKPTDEASKPIETVDTQKSIPEERDSTTDLEGKDVDTRLLDDRHLDTVEKLKKRSERFKLPLTSDKEVPTIKVENEPLAPKKTDTQADSEVKQERPARKRRWISG